MNDVNGLDPISLMMKEFNLIQEAKSAQSQDDRAELISELERTPIHIHPFHDRWIRINEAHSYSGWTENGYEPQLSDIPENIQVLAAVGYGKSDIENGGFHQFFTNGTGIFAPEMLRWFEDVGLDPTASIMKKAIAKFGAIFPRSHSERVSFLDQFPKDTEGYRDPFRELTRQFYDSFSDKSKLYNDAADKRLRETCGVTNLGMSIEEARNKAI